MWIEIQYVQRTTVHMKPAWFCLFKTWKVFSQQEKRNHWLRSHNPSFLVFYYLLSICSSVTANLLYSFPSQMVGKISCKRFSYWQWKIMDAECHLQWWIPSCSLWCLENITLACKGYCRFPPSSMEEKKIVHCVYHNVWQASSTGMLVQSQKTVLRSMSRRNRKNMFWWHCHK